MAFDFEKAREDANAAKAKPFDFEAERAKANAAKVAQAPAQEQEAPVARGERLDHPNRVDFSDPVGMIRAGLQGATFGLAGKVQGAAASLPGIGPYLNRPMWGEGSDSLPPEKTRAQATNEAQDLLEGAAKRHPVAEFLGSLAAPVPGLGEIKGAAGIGKLALQGAGMGAVSAYGRSRPEDDAATTAKDIGLGAGLGGLGGGLLGALGAVGGKAIGGLGGAAERRAVKAAGAIQSDLRGKSDDQVQRIGRNLLDNNVIPFGGGKKAILTNAKALASGSGAGMGAILNEADAATGHGFDYGKTIDRIKGFLDRLNPTERRAAGGVERMLADLEEAATAPGKSGFSAANDIKSSLYDNINYKADPKLKTTLEKRAVHELMDEIDTQLPAKQSEFRALKQNFGSAAEAKKWAGKAMNRELGNNAFGLGDLVLAAGGLGGSGTALATGHTLGGLATLAGTGTLAVGKKLARERGDAALAVGLNGADKAATAIAKAAAGYGPAIQQAFQMGGMRGVMATFEALKDKPDFPAEDVKGQIRLGLAGGPK